MVFALVPVFSLAVCVIAHVSFVRWGPSRSQLKASWAACVLGGLTAGGFGAVFASTSASKGAFTPERAGYTVLWLCTYLCLAYCYMIGFYNSEQTARRIRLVIELLMAGERGLTVEEILARYNARMMVDARLDRLLAGGQIVERDGRFFSGWPAMLWVARFMVFLKMLLFGVDSEFLVPPRRQTTAR